MYHDPASRFEAGFIFLLAFTILSAFYTVVIWINGRFGDRKNLGITAIPRFLFGGRYKTRKAKIAYILTIFV